MTTEPKPMPITINDEPYVVCPITGRYIQADRAEPVNRQMYEALKRCCDALQNNDMQSRPFLLGIVLNAITAAEQCQTDDELTIDDYKEVIADHKRLVHELDVALNGEHGAAKQASLCDIVGQVKSKNTVAIPRDVLDKVCSTLWVAYNNAIRSQTDKFILEAQKLLKPYAQRSATESEA